jgi:hypothetical protein
LPKNGINKTIIITNTAQQNGVSKKKNHTLIGATLSMLINSHLPKMFWGKLCQLQTIYKIKVLIKLS